MSSAASTSPSPPDPPADAIRVGSGQRPAAHGDRRLDWWRDAKFGLFIHWGLYAIPAGRWHDQPIPGIGEWIMQRAQIPVREYEQLARQFNPVHFDADAWVRLAKRAGQRYLVITAKHHDGFCLFDSKLTDYTVVKATPFGRDPLRELAAACAKHDIRLCFYYSQTQDWHHPHGDGNDWDYAVPSDDQFDSYVRDYVMPQVRELLSNYGPIGLIWFDTPKRMTEAQSQTLVDYVHALQPDCLVNGRVGNHLGDYASTRDNVIPADQLAEMDWETPATINDTWGYKQDDHNWKSVTDLVRKLVDIASKGGNYLLNVGPTAEGIIPAPSIERLEGVGDWLRRHAESVYQTRGGPLHGLDWGRATRRDNVVYLHLFDWPTGGTVHVPDLGRVASAQVLGGEVLPVRSNSAGFAIEGPAQAPDTTDSVIRLELA